MNRIAALRALCERKGISRAEAIRQAVDRLVEDEARKKASRDEVLETTFGAWKHRGIDTNTYLEEIRKANGIASLEGANCPRQQHR
ncbi:MAG: ribbon-helix-helix protein, CopG family [Dehalococcoidia bacterium]|nr:ribbon-helix-helix protein, CopG family [Dehalococcoidia bacterium]